MLEQCLQVAHGTRGADSRRHGVDGQRLGPGGFGDQGNGICTGKDGKYLSKKVKEQNAIAEALKKTGADILVEPQFTYTYDKKGRLTTVEVSGYPARYRNFRSLTKEDAEAINALRNPSTQQQVLMLPVVQK